MMKRPMFAAAALGAIVAGLTPKSVIVDELKQIRDHWPGGPADQRQKVLDRRRGRAKCISVAEGKRRARKARNVSKEKARGRR
jgi:hypothetical protein